MPFAVFRADAAPSIGAGHVRRCLTLADELVRRGWRVGFASIAESARVVPALATTPVERLELTGESGAEPAAMRNAFATPDIVIVDHYGRDVHFERTLRGWAKHVAALDDLPERDHDVDLLIDQTAGRRPDDYAGRVPTGATILTGTDYVLLRPEIATQQCNAESVPPHVRRLLVTFGGADADDLSSRAVAALADPRLDALDADVVVGRGYRDPQALAGRAADNTRVHIDPPDLPRMMAEADLALAGSGTTAWELAYLGVPALLIENSKGTVVAGMTAAGAARNLGSAAGIKAADIAEALAGLSRDIAARATMRDAGRRLVDGRGPARVADAIDKLLT